MLITLFVIGGFFFQAEDGIRALVRSRGLGDVYKRQYPDHGPPRHSTISTQGLDRDDGTALEWPVAGGRPCLLYTSDAADERSSVDLGGRRILKKKRNTELALGSSIHYYMHERMSRSVYAHC